MTDNSSVNFQLILFQVWIKGSHQNPNFETFKCSGKICHIPYVILQTTSHLKVMLDKSVNNVLGEGMQFLDKCSPLNFNSLDFPFRSLSEVILIPHMIFEIWSQFCINFAPFCNNLART